MSTFTVADPVGVAEIAARAGVSSSAVGLWRARYADFPPPLFTTGGGRFPVWSWPTVARWIEARRSPEK